MAIDFLTPLSPSWREKCSRTLERKKMIVAQLDAEYGFSEDGSRHIIATLREKGYSGKLDKHIIYADAKKNRLPYEYLRGDEEVRKRMDDLRKKPDRKGDYLGINCLLKDNPDIADWDDVMAKLKALSDSQDNKPASAESQEYATAENGQRGLPYGKPATQGPFHILADTIDPMIAACEARREGAEEFEIRLSAIERDVRKLKEKFSSFQHMLVALETALVTDMPRLDELKTRAEGLGIDLVQNLPEQTATGGYWKGTLTAVYRKRMKKFLRDPHIPLKDREATVDTIRQIMVDPFSKNGMDTEARHNGDDGDASMIAGIARGAPYYKSRVGIHRRLIWLVEVNRIHFIETETKETYTYA